MYQIKLTDNLPWDYFILFYDDYLDACHNTTDDAAH